VRHLATGYWGCAAVAIEAVVALKTLAQSKRRLSAVLTDEQRCDLVEAMAQDVLSCLMAHPEIDTVHAVCGEGWARSDFPEGALVMGGRRKRGGRSHCRLRNGRGENGGRTVALHPC
jgi:hypothetical protein